jgi:hypothetical protein
MTLFFNKKVSRKNPLHYVIPMNKVISYAQVKIKREFFLIVECNKPLKFGKKTENKIAPLHQTLNKIDKICKERKI